MFLRFFLSFICLFTFLFDTHQGFAGQDDGESIYFYNGIPGCGCFYHCKCFGHYLSKYENDGFPNNSEWHPFSSEDRLWHVFMKKFLKALREGPYSNSGESDVRDMVFANNHSGYVCLMSEYLESLNKLGHRLEEARIRNLKLGEIFYPHPKDHDKLVAHNQYITDRANKAFKTISTIPELLIPIYKELIASCPHTQSYNMLPTYNRGFIALLEGNIDQSLADIHTFIQLAKRNGKEHLLTSKVFQSQGEAFMEVGQYHQAIDSLNCAISKDPKNLEAYFQRASAYFEIGDFDRSLDDYLVSKKSRNFIPNAIPSLEFVSAFTAATVGGAKDSVCEFLPFMCHSVYGLSECLWAFGEHPVDSVKSLAGAGYEMAEHVVDYLKTVDRETLNEYASELVQLYENFDQLSDNEKGGLLGYVVGKFGVDIFIGSATVKGYSACKKLKEANRICNLESMALSTSSKEAVVSKGLQRYVERSEFFENSVIHWDKQNKHVVGKHNYQEGKSVFQHKDAEGLLKNYAGNGMPCKGELGQPGYREIVDFEEIIGVWKSKDGELSIPTTKGVIHYSKKSAHIVPEHPDKKIW